MPVSLMPPVQRSCIFVGCFYPAGSLAPGIYIGIGQVALCTAQGFYLAAAEEDVFRRNPVTILSFVWASPKTGFSIFVHRRLYPIDRKNRFAAPVPFFGSKGFCFCIGIRWNAFPVKDGQTGKAIVMKMVHNNRFYNGSGKIVFRSTGAKPATAPNRVAYP